MRKIDLYYHLFINNDWDNIFKTHINKIKNSGLINHIDNFYLGIINPNNPQINFNLYINEIFRNTNIIPVIIQSNNNNFEYLTLDLLFNNKLNYKDNPKNILYLHSKGASKEGHEYNQNIKDWDNIMSYFCIENFQKCIELLHSSDLYDSVGVNYSPQPVPHFSGNFWWLKSSSLYKLTTPPNNIHDKYDRCSAEFWLGNNNLNLKGIYNSGANHYYTPYPKNLYEGKFEI